MPKPANLIEEFQDLVNRLFRGPRAWGRVTDTEDGAIIHRIGTIKRLLAREDD